MAVNRINYEAVYVVRPEARANDGQMHSGPAILYLKSSESKKFKLSVRNAAHVSDLRTLEFRHRIEVFVGHLHINTFVIVTSILTFGRRTILHCVKREN